MREGWKHVRFGDLVYFDKRFNGMGNAQKKVMSFPHVSAEKLKAIRCSNGNVKLLSTGSFDGFTTEELAGNNLSEAEVLSIPTGGAANLKYYKGKFVDSGNILCVAAKDNVYLKFVFYAMLYKKNIIESMYRGASIKHPQMKEIYQININMPDYDTQIRVVEELDKINNLINLKKSQLEDLQVLAQSIFYTMFGDPITNDKGWEVKKLGEVCDVARGGSPRPISAYITDGTNGINWIKIGDAVEGSMFITSTKEKIKPEGLKKTRYVHKGDFILSNSMSFGKPYILNIEGCIHDGWLVIHDKYNVFNKEFLYYMLAHPSMYLQFKNLAVGGVVSNLNSNLVRNTTIFIPSIKDQQFFSKKIDAIEEQKRCTTSTIKDLNTLLSSRMQFWFD